MGDALGLNIDYLCNRGRRQVCKVIVPGVRLRLLWLLVPYFQIFCHKKQEECYQIRGVNIVAER